MCCTRLVANAGPKNRQKSASGHHPTTSTIGKNLLSSNTCPTCPHNMVNFGPLVIISPTASHMLYSALACCWCSLYVHVQQFDHNERHVYDAQLSGFLPARHRVPLSILRRRISEGSHSIYILRRRRSLAWVSSFFSRNSAV